MLTSSWRFVHRTRERLLIPSTKQIESRMLDLPDPFSPVIAVNWESKGPTVVRIE